MSEQNANQPAAQLSENSAQNHENAARAAEAEAIKAEALLLQAEAEKSSSKPLPIMARVRKRVPVPTENRPAMEARKKMVEAWQQAAKEWENAAAGWRQDTSKSEQEVVAWEEAAKAWEAAADAVVEDASGKKTAGAKQHKQQMNAARCRALSAENWATVATIRASLFGAEEFLSADWQQNATDWQIKAREHKEHATIESEKSAREKAKEERAKYYHQLRPEAQLLRFVQRTPDKARPKKHTMGKEPFLTYIGRFDTLNKRPLRTSPGILCKKFSQQQKDWLEMAYRDGLPVYVIGAPVSDYEALLELRNRKVINYDAKARPVTNMPLGAGERHKRPDKDFNKWRAQMMWTTPDSDERLNTADKAKVEAGPLATPAIELWVIVFPSPQYVDQVAELIRAILDDMHKWRVPKNKSISPETAPQVRVWHFRELEKHIARWSGLEGSLPLYIRHGDVVAIGNVELLLPGIELVGYQRKFADWEWFGLDNMFGIQILVNTASNSRIVLLGVTECFWGEASANYVEALLQAGARQILYGSKAATMIDRKSISKIKSPGSFSIYVRHGENQGLTQLNSTLTADESLRHLAELASIRTAGVGVTVPTVIGENHDQRDRLKDLNPSTMDDEDGYIAKVIQEHNHRFQSSIDQAGFIPVHYISDYIHQRGEVAGKKQQSLAQTHVTERNARFAKIGSFFGVYATIHGLREYVPLPKPVSQTYLVGASVEELMVRVQPFLDAGLMREAIATLTGSYRVLQLPIANIQAIVLLCQKYGFLDDALHALHVLTTDKKVHWAAQSPEDRLRMEIVRLKLHTQAGRFEEAELNVENIENNFSRILEKNRQYSAFCRRKALIYAFKGEEVEARYWFDTAEQQEKEVGLPQDEATSDLYRMIASLALGATVATDWEAKLVKARQKFLTQPKVKSTGIQKAEYVWGTNPEKSALTALFVEAALHLVARSIDDYRGMVRLAVAHLHNIGIGGSERSEGYGELIAFIRDPVLKDLFRRAIRMDGGGRRDFQRFLQLTHLWPQVQESLKIFKLDLTKRAEALQDELDKLDEKFSSSTRDMPAAETMPKEESHTAAEPDNPIDYDSGSDLDSISLG